MTKPNWGAISANHQLDARAVDCVNARRRQEAAREHTVAALACVLAITPPVGAENLAVIERLLRDAIKELT
jgi:GT2 family glycosyltransferase